ncbi:hypothetical protein [Novosphingobium sp. KACC 22771]|uniref:hypothetical protein n=1 Tax=Novosphingobium sp. KACC 22771 TaxID=3025670 RepID=UPI0023653A47|nr:hypothetical protein [Novosphingobium sp. KACC 22771]WDF71173.1 hypothetical protein PQ467_10055 [Novosphingobium sp. KACC 22771]
MTGDRIWLGRVFGLWLIPVLALLFLLLGLAPRPAQAQSEPKVFYCYAPDPETGAVYVTQTMNVGPLSERSTYGRQFAQWLKRKGTISANVQGYCTMSWSVAEAEKGKTGMQTGWCPECLQIKRFVDVQWDRAGAGAKPVAAPKVAMRAPEPPLERSPKAPVMAMDSGEPWLVVLGNTETGQIVVEKNQPDLANVALAKAHSRRATGWEELLVTREAGWGVALCVKKPGAVRFFLAHSQPDQRSAVARARDEASAYAAKVKLPVSVCGAPWNAEADGGGDGGEQEESWIDTIKGKIRMMITCDPALRPMSSAAIRAEEGKPASEQRERARMNESGPDGRRPCLDNNNEMRLHKGGAAIGVRG